MAIVPITPEEVEQTRNARIPDEIIQIFNDLIIENWDGNKSLVLQKNILAKSIGTICEHKSDFDFNWLNVENIFRESGWIVEYKSPTSPYYDDGDAFFVFTKPKILR